LIKIVNVKALLQVSKWACVHSHTHGGGDETVVDVVVVVNEVVVEETEAGVVGSGHDLQGAQVGIWQGWQTHDGQVGQATGGGQTTR